MAAKYEMMMENLAKDGDSPDIHLTALLQTQHFQGPRILKSQDVLPWLSKMLGNDLVGANTIFLENITINQCKATVCVGIMNKGVLAACGLKDAFLTLNDDMRMQTFRSGKRYKASRLFCALYLPLTYVSSAQSMRTPSMASPHPTRFPSPIFALSATFSTRIPCG